MLEAVIFDKDGVLVDGEPLKARGWTTALNEHGIEVDDSWYLSRVGITGDERKKLVMQQFGISEEEAEAIFQRKREVYKSLSLNNPLVLHSSVNFLRYVSKQGLKLGVASSDYRDSVEQQLESIGILDLFGIIVSGIDDLGRGRDKPKPDIYLFAAEKLKVNPENCLAVEDTKSGVDAAKNARMKCLGYINLNSGSQDLSRADYRTEDLSLLHMNDLQALWK